MPRPPGLPATGTRLGRYTLLEELGAGGMAVVYRAEDETLRREVAVKVLLPGGGRRAERAARFLREGRAAAALDHPGILRILDVGGGGDGDEPAYLVMELVRGGSLADFLERAGTPVAEAAALLALPVAEALGAAHRAGVVHRDVKPQNVLRREDGTLVLCDFGMARRDTDESVTATGEVLGTPAYMAPEQARGEDTGAAADVYGLGATLYRAATGALPASGSAHVVLLQVSRGETVPPLRQNPAIGPAMARLLGALMAADPARRPPDGDAAAALLRAYLAEAGLDPVAELAAFLADPAAWNRAHVPAIVGREMRRAEEARGRRQWARALAHADRVLCLEPGHAGAEALVRRASSGSRWRRVLAVAAAVVAAAALGFGGYALLRRAPTPPRADAAPVPVDAPPLLTDAAPGDAAAAAALAPDAAPALVLRRGDAAPRAPDAAPALPDARPALPDAAAPAEPALLEVKILPWCELSIDGESRGRSPLATPLSLAPGRHTLRCAQPVAGGPVVEQTIDLAPGEHRTVRLDLFARAVVKVELRAGTASIDGAAVAGGQVSLTPGRHRVEILSGGKPVAATWIDVPVGGCTLRDTPELGCH